ncbi:sensor histidine kinase [Millisia brevis]|uniref:sensor histidine kinase n=1 Tax=Millisia brevis TaxID=264148 RepID=UPI00082B8F4E|nr:HAMP domain-containing sensor histidine kinase [Millisia brevis]
MRRRILWSLLAVVLCTAVMLGVPLAYTAWMWVENITRDDMRRRLDQIATEVIAQEGPQGFVIGDLDLSAIRLAVPPDARLLVEYPVAGEQMRTAEVGPDSVPSPLIEEIQMGRSGTLVLAMPTDRLDASRLQVVVAVSATVAASAAVATLVAGITSRRLAEPMRRLAGRAERLSDGDFRVDSTEYDIAELDRISRTLNRAAAEVVDRLQREHALVADVSHQLRSRLTAIRLRLDELVDYPDPAVVDEANEAISQVDRLSSAIDELLHASRSDGAAHAIEIPLVGELEAILVDWRDQFRRAGRELTLEAEEEISARVTGSRLRESIGVLVHNALVHGGGNCVVSLRSISSQVLGRPERTACIEVADQGPGIAEELAPHIFDRGVSGAGSTGVGLALARALIEADGGRIKLRRFQPPIFAVFLPIESGRDRADDTGVRAAIDAEPR